MRRTRALLGVTALASGLTLLPATGAHADGATLTVGNPARCASAQYPTINAALADAVSGDTIKVCAGLYAEHVTVTTPGLTFVGAQAGVSGVGRSRVPESTISSADGVFTLAGTADDTTIDGFTISSARVDNANGISAFQGSSGLKLVDNVIKLNSNGINLQNPDPAKPALITDNAFTNNNAGGDVGNNPNTGTGVFISNGPGNNLTITRNKFMQHSQTAINFAGDSTRRSVGLRVLDNFSKDDATFVVATNSSNAAIEDNVVQTSGNVPGGGHGTGILDFGANDGLRIGHNTMKATSPSTSSGISVSNYAGSSSSTIVVGNQVAGWGYGIKVVSGNTSAYVSDNKVNGAQIVGIIAQAGTSGIYFVHNRAAGDTTACSDATTGTGTAGTANFWRRNTGDTSEPAGLC